MADFPTGRFCWYECYCDDPNAAARFYGKLTGWTSAPWGPGDYTVIMNGETSIGGYMQLTAEMKNMGVPPHWLLYIATDDADATAARATELGGRVIRAPFDIDEVGRIVVIADPQGAVFCGFQPAGPPPGTDAPAGIGDFSWHELMTTDWQAAWAFYSALFRWRETDRMEMGEAGTYLVYGNGAHPLGGFFNKPPEVPVPAWMLYVRVPDVDDSVETVKASGGQVLIGPMEVPGGDRIAQCLDPQGAAFAVHWVAAVGASQ
ncbi:MAG TPA: VOC family protein [Gemmatimonadales bacterium]|jgi:hypothetical protein